MKFLLRPLLVLLAGVFILGARQADEKRPDYQAPARLTTGTGGHRSHYLARPAEAGGTGPQWHQLYLPVGTLAPASSTADGGVWKASYSPNIASELPQP